MIIHPVFEGIPHNTSAAACSEVFAGGDYRFIQDKEHAVRYGEGEAFLTNPDVQLLTAQVNYMEEEPSGAWQQPVIFAHLNMDQASTQDILDEYGESVAKYQALGNHPQVMQIMAHIPKFNRHDNHGWGAVGDWFGQLVLNESKSLVVAHAMGRIAKDGDALAGITFYPHLLRHKLGVLVDHVFIDTIPNCPTNKQTGLYELVGNQHLHQRLGDIAACNQLLNPTQLAVTVGRYVH